MGKTTEWGLPVFYGEAKRACGRITSTNCWTLTGSDRSIMSGIALEHFAALNIVFPPAVAHEKCSTVLSRVLAADVVRVHKDGDPACHVRYLVAPTSSPEHKTLPILLSVSLCQAVQAGQARRFWAGVTRKGKTHVISGATHYLVRLSELPGSEAFVFFADNEHGRVVRVYRNDTVGIVGAQVVPCEEALRLRCRRGHDMLRGVMNLKNKNQRTKLEDAALHQLINLMSLCVPRLPEMLEQIIQTLQRYAQEGKMRNGVRTHAVNVLRELGQTANF